MKILKMLCFMTFIIMGCSEESGHTIDLSGIWVPYEIRFNDGKVIYGPFTNGSIFGVYAESVQLNNDKTFIPVIWTDKDNYVLKSDESGNFTYEPKAGRLIFIGGVWDMEFDISDHMDDTLTLTYTGDIKMLGSAGTQYRLNKEVW